MSNARELTNHLARLLRQERGAMADFLLALADFDRKRLWRELGHTSLFYYLHRELRLSKGAAPAASSKTRIRQQHDRHGFAVEQVRIERHTERRALGIGLRQAKVLTRVVSQRQLPTDEDHAAAQVPTREYQPDQPSDELARPAPDRLQTQGRCADDVTSPLTGRSIPADRAAAVPALGTGPLPAHVSSNLGRARAETHPNRLPKL